MPSASSWASRSARLDAEMPTTATIAAMPMAMPSAVSSVRDRRSAARPTAVRARSTRRSRRAARASCRGSLVVDHHAVAQLDTRRGAARRDLAVVGDQHDRRPAACRSREQRRGSRRRCGCRGCRWARRRARSPGSPTSARAIATRWRSPPDSFAGRCSSAVRRARRARAPPRRARRRSRAATPRVEQPVGDVLERRSARRQVELLEHEPDAPAAQRRQLRGRAARPTSCAVDAHRARRSGGRARRSTLQQRRLARARTARRWPPARPWPTVRSTPSNAAPAVSG